MSTRSSILVTGGAGYIGSHTVVELLAAGYDVFIIDNLCNSRLSAIDNIAAIAGRKPEFLNLDMRDRAGLRNLFSAHSFDAVLHFAGLKSVGESVAKPLLYYDNNVAGTTSLLASMAEAGVKTLVFSSSATVYGEPRSVPIKEDFPLSATNAYGRSKLMIEDILRDTVRSDPRWRIAALFQSSRRARIGADRREPQWRSQQPAALCGPSRRGHLAAAFRLRRGLSDTRWHGSSRLHSCGRPGRRAPCGSQGACESTGLAHHESRNRAGSQRS